MGNTDQKKNKQANTQWQVVRNTMDENQAK